MKLKPAPGLVVRDPVLGDVLPPEGREVTPSDYWHRRLRDGDVELAEISVAVEPAEPEEAR